MDGRTADTEDRLPNVATDDWLDHALTVVRRMQERSAGQRMNSAHMEATTEGEASTATKPEPSIDLRSLETVNEPDSNLFCPICHCLFVQPVQLPCQHVFCRECLESTPTGQGLASTLDISCPSCRRPWARQKVVKAPRLIVRILEDVVVRCPLSETGCEETLPRATVEDHVAKYCQYALADCPSDECNKKVARRLAGSKCLHQLGQCEDCSKELMEIDLDKHRRNSCAVACEECAGCKQLFRALQIQTHTDECLERVIACGGEQFGCKFTSRRRGMPDHERQCLLQQASPFLARQVARIDEHETTIRELRLKNRALADSVIEMHSTVRDVLGEDSTQNHPHSHGESSSSAPPFESQAAHLLQLHTSLEDQVRRMETTLAALDARLDVQTLNQNLRASEEKLHRDAVETQMRRQLQWLVSAKLQSQRAASSVLRAAGRDEAGPSEVAEPSGANPTLRRRRSDEAPEGWVASSMPLRRSSDSAREKL